jgi:hypothetical protein
LAWWLVAFAAGGFVGCQPPLVGVGRSTTLPGAAQPVADASVGDVGVVSSSPVAPDFATRLVRVGPADFLSSDHAAGRCLATVYATPSGKDGLAELGGGFAPGTQLVMACVDRKTHQPGPTFYMDRSPACGEAGPCEFRYGVMEDASPRPEAAPLCGRCHDEAPHDHVFRLPEER